MILAVLRCYKMYTLFTSGAILLPLVNLFIK